MNIVANPQAGKSIKVSGQSTPGSGGIKIKSGRSHPIMQVSNLEDLPSASNRAPVNRPVRRFAASSVSSSGGSDESEGDLDSDFDVMSNDSKVSAPVMKRISKDPPMSSVPIRRPERNLPNNLDDEDDDSEVPMPSFRTQTPFRPPSRSRAEAAPESDARTPSRPEGFSGASFGSSARHEDEKGSLLQRLKRFSNKGMHVKKLDMSNTYEEIKAEFDKHQRQMQMMSSVKMGRRVLMAMVTGTEYVNKRYNPLNLKLNGWAEHVFDSIEDYDEHLENMFDTYGDSVRMSPEMSILVGLMGSAFMFHLSNSLFQGSLPIGLPTMSVPHSMAPPAQAAPSALPTSFASPEDLQHQEIAQSIQDAVRASIAGQARSPGLGPDAPLMTPPAAERKSAPGNDDEKSQVDADVMSQISDILSDSPSAGPSAGTISLKL